MKILPLLLCSLLATPFWARAQDEMPADTTIPAPKSAASGDALVWKIAPEVGSRWQLRSFSRMKQSQTIPAQSGQPAQKIEVNIITRMTADYDVLARDRFGASTIRFTYRDLTTDSMVKANGKEMGAGAKTGMGKALDGASFTIKQAPDGSIWNIMGLEQAQEKLLMHQGLTDPAERAMARQMSNSIFSKGALKKLMQSVSGGTYPSYPVRVGESWDYQIDVPTGLPFSFNFSGTRTLKSLDENVASIGEQMIFGGGKMELPVPNQGKVSVDMNGIKGVFSGTTRVDRSSGLALESTINQKLSGSVQMKIFDLKGALQHQMAVSMEQTGTTHAVMERQ